ncbi:MAG: HRDC domain-containing protein [Bacteroidales bacterium]|nr:HRDC domain-containing protein [Bacteroidales bacterium]MDZ4204183.1 HRDC domain-containing protein [Bacteroidales bacterium]
MTSYTNPRLKLAADFVQYTNKHLFLTGKAGTGKTTFLRNLKSITHKRMVVVAPTGVAAINAGGVTIHSFFQLPFGPQIPEELASRLPATGGEAKHAASRYQRFQREKINIIKSLDLLVIDEISMVRADLLDAIDMVLRRYRNREKPFGGVQLLMIGDLQQLAPIAKEAEWSLLKDYYDTVYFFSSKALQQTDYVSIELTNVYRQQEETFINLLGKIRNNNLDADAIKELNNRYIPDFTFKPHEGYITLTTHNHQAQQINQARLEALKGKIYPFKAVIKDDFPELSFPTDEELKLKIEAQVMFIKNDPSPSKEFYNGKIGKIVDIKNDKIFVLCPGGDDPIAVSPLAWHNCRYTLDDNTKEITETIIGTFVQYPLKLAWAVTIHKSQGLTFGKAIIDANQAFAYGQVYVALSRCRTLEGMVLSSAIKPSAIKSDYAVSRYVQRIEQNTPDEKQLVEARHAYQKSLVEELFNFSLFHKRLGYLLKLLRDNLTAFSHNALATFTTMDHKLKTEVSVIVEKFMPEVQHLISEEPDLEMNEALQIRIRKACNYFAQKFDEIVLSVDREVESDNKAAKRPVDDLLERFNNEALVKQSCLRRCQQGFVVSAYLETRAKASIETPKQKKKATITKAGGTPSSYPELRKRLKSWRDLLAEELDLPVYMIIPKKALTEIAESLPASRTELLGITGMGKIKVEKFGSEILGMITEYLAEKNINRTVDDSPLPILGKEKKPESKQVSFEMFEVGKTIEEVAHERGLAPSTIEGHLSYYVGTGELELEKLMPPEKIAWLMGYFAEADDLSLGIAKEVLGNDVSWSELRYAAKRIDFERSSRVIGEL